MSAHAPAANLDEITVGNVVGRFALSIGCTDSNVTAAIAYAIRNGSNTLSAIRGGKARAEQLRTRELQLAIHKASA